jgi:hypothetical protein
MTGSRRYINILERIRISTIGINLYFEINGLDLNTITKVN